MQNQSIKISLIELDNSKNVDDYTLNDILQNLTEIVFYDGVVGENGWKSNLIQDRIHWILSDLNSLKKINADNVNFTNENKILFKIEYQNKVYVILNKDYIVEEKSKQYYLQNGSIYMCINQIFEKQIDEIGFERFFNIFEQCESSFDNVHTEDYYTKGTYASYYNKNYNKNRTVLNGYLNLIKDLTHNAEEIRKEESNGNVSATYRKGEYILKCDYFSRKSMNKSASGAIDFLITLMHNNENCMVVMLKNEKKDLTNGNVITFLTLKNENEESFNYAIHNDYSVSYFLWE